MSGPDEAHPASLAEVESNFGRHLGLRLVSAEPDRVVAELLVGEEHCNRNGVLHGGAIMALADNTGGTATLMNLPAGTGTTTIESKTNFFAAIRLGEIARAECTPLHRGRSTQVWQTRITRPDGKLAALVTQTQMVLTRG
ncbi:PaaI family thioesterase [Enterovirga sp.]|uniref:PaaI family thioesterase n=1 Tax=Enterovirga sp. TaxID=2026350 RepID=UPI002D0DDCEF|nr:PaaI family thioesterase [Enterovirga sp.]HMO31158.1 PaaI family thioesterase [Enterovirga sp.]